MKEKVIRMRKLVTMYVDAMRNQLKGDCYIKPLFCLNKMDRKIKLKNAKDKISKVSSQFCFS